MLLTVDLPHPMEIRDLEMDTEERRVSFSPRILGGQGARALLYLTATGDGGVETRVAVMFNARAGVFSLQRLGGEIATCQFDLPAKEFEKRKMLKVAKKKRNPESGDGNTAGEDEDLHTAATLPKALPGAVGGNLAPRAGSA